ncbi:MAG: phosphoribosylanthranilate isomerase [Candidatus Azobacteroides sp.]|nr:phosphoribosylanthranilate isomerase [Candidatus Azobacteroides sp.]
MAHDLKIKVCGMKYPDNISEVLNLHPDYIGFIFYEKSPRFVSDFPPAIVSLPGRIKKTGVFVNESTDTILKIVRTFNLQAVQLHGDESFDDCAILKKSVPEVIKAVGVHNTNDLLQAAEYEDCCDFMLFDTKTTRYGGSGNQYDWEILKEYRGRIPFFLSGGLSINDIDRIIRFRHPLFYGIDVNSCFETEPAFKNINLLQKFIDNVKNKK